MGDIHPWLYPLRGVGISGGYHPNLRGWQEGLVFGTVEQGDGASGCLACGAEIMKSMVDKGGTGGVRLECSRG